MSKLLEIALGIVTGIGAFSRPAPWPPPPRPDRNSAFSSFGRSRWALPTFLAIGLGRKSRTRRLPWAWLDLTDPEHPRLRAEVA